MTLLSYILPIFMTMDFVFAQSLPVSTGVATPACLQTRELTDPAASNIATALSSAVPEACNPSLEKNSTYGNRSIGYYRLDSFNFNISHALNAPSGANLPSACPDAFNAIIASCVQDAPAAGFWGGWMLQGPNNYSISNSNFPANGLTSLAFSVRASSSGLVGTGNLFSRSTVGISGSLPSGLPIYSSPSSSTWSYKWQSATESASDYGPSSGSSTGAAALSHSIVSSGFVPTLSISVLGTLSASGIPASIPSSSIRVSGTGSTGSLAAVSSGAHSGGQAASSNSSSASKTPGSPPLRTGQLPTAVGSSRAAATLTSGASSPPAPASTVGNSGPSSIASITTSSRVLATTLASLPSFTLPPSGIKISPSGTTASSQGVIFGGLLFSLSKSIHSVDLTIPTIKAEVIQDVENTIKQATDLFDDLGGTDITGSCNGESKLKRLSNPFTGLENLAGDITKIIGCADEVLNSLRENLDKDTPDPDLTDDLLDDLGTLADETDPDDDPTKSASETTASQTASATSSSSPSSSALTSASSTSSSSSSASGCTGCCPTDVPALPTDGTPAVTAAPTDFDTLDKRIVPERFQRMAKRRPDVPIPKINNCILATPNNWPVTTPAYPGGYEFWASDKSGVLGPLTTVSRYYRSTTFGAPACTPTITKIDAVQWTFQQSGPNVPENDKVSVDHAYEIGFLKSFMESIIDQPSGVTCSNANKQFFDTGNCADNRLQPIFGSLPSYANPDFVAMSQWLNGDAKGWVSGVMSISAQIATAAVHCVYIYADPAPRFSGQHSILSWVDLFCPAKR